MAWTVGEQRRFDGVYVAHWEVPRFEAVAGRRLFGWLPRIERCELRTGDGVQPLEDVLFGGQLPADWRHSPGARFAISFDGRITERGRFGHMGWCRWRVLVLRWIRVERI